MSDRFNNKKLLFLLSGLVVLLLLTILVKSPRQEATLKSHIVEMDTAAITKVVLFPRANRNNPVEFTKKDGQWMVQQGDVVAKAEQGAVRGMLGNAVNIKPESLAASDKSKWEEYELTDSLGTRVKFYNQKNKLLADLMIGKVNFKQAANPYGGYYGGNNIQGTSYVRLTNDKEVYAVDGFLAFSFNGSFDDWRDKSFIATDKENITTIRFTLPADSSYTLTKEGNRWLIAGMEADSASVAGFINSLVQMNGERFKDHYIPVLSPGYQMTVEGNNLLNYTVKCYKGEGSEEYILNSSLNPDVYFLSERNGLFDRLFKSQNYFLKDKRKKIKVS